MRSLVKIFAAFFVIFSLSVIIFRWLDLLSFAAIEALLTDLRSYPIYVTGGIIACLLLSDLVLTVPSTLTIIFSGVILGPLYGPLFALIGTLAAGALGYSLGWFGGRKLLKRFFSKNEKDWSDSEKLFLKLGPWLIVVARAIPMLPEITSCLAGVYRMDFKRYLFFYVLGTVPYVTVLAYSGSHTAVTKPWPAIVTVLFLNLSLWFLLRVVLTRLNR